MKTCTACGLFKEEHEYGKDKKGKEGLSAQCKSCRNIKMKEYAKDYNNRPEVKEHRRRYRASEDRQRKRREYLAEYANRPGKRELRSAYSKLRRTGLGIPDVLTSHHIIWCKQQLCSYCGNVGGQHDHIIPVSRGGDNSIENIVPACQKCNDSKGTKTPEEWKNRWYEQ